MNSESIVKALQQKNLLLQEKVEQIVPLATEMAEAQYDYRIKLASEIVKLRINGESVSLAETIAKGDKGVASKKVAHVIAEAKHRACLKSIAVTMVATDTLRSLLKTARDEGTAADKNYYD